MIDKELIRQEIERRVEETPSTEGAVALESLLDYINSISEEPASEDLEEYYTKKFLPKEWFAKPGHRTISQFNFFTAHHFAEWQKQQMMKNVVECTWGSQATSSFMSAFPNIECGDKVKIIILKTE